MVGFFLFFFLCDVGFTIQNTNSIDKYNIHDYYIFIKQNQLFTYFGLRHLNTMVSRKQLKYFI